MTDTVDDVAEARLGIEELLDEQRTAVRAAVRGRDVLAVMPTGSGKSAIYQLAAELRPGPTVVVSPLLALQHDQVHAITASDLGRAVMVNSQQRARDRDAALGQFARGDVEFLFLAPEQLTKDETRDVLRSARPSLIAVDEAHCVATWGHDFRPDYLRLQDTIELLDHPPVIALTATAAPPVREEIRARLGMRDPLTIVAGFDRPEITLTVATHTDTGAKWQAVVDATAAASGSGIVYAATRKAVVALADALTERGVSTGVYHGTLARARRADVHEAFLAGDVRVVVATNAFGMGIDKPDVRFVFHLDVPGSLDAYYQEVGRAGRDGEPARADLFYAPDDLKLQRFMQTRRKRDGESAEAAAYRRMQASRLEMMRAYAESRACRRMVLLGYYGEAFTPPCGACDVCLAGNGEAAADEHFHVGERVEHREWGDGTVMIVDTDSVVVLFPEHGYRRLAASFVAEQGILRS